MPLHTMYFFTLYFLSTSPYVLDTFHSKAQWLTIPQLPDNSACPMPVLKSSLKKNQKILTAVKNKDGYFLG